MAGIRTADGIVFALDEDEERRQIITDRLVAFNKTHTTALPVAVDDVRRLEPASTGVYAVNPAGDIVGGVVGRTHAVRDWLEVTILWVAERARGEGLGRELMARAEQEALRRGCRYARATTSNFQAPGFYERIGYRLYGTLENCPPGVTCYYFWKELTGNRPSDSADEL
jgi:GNAT superfamily N-acetyltransferase